MAEISDKLNETTLRALRSDLNDVRRVVVGIADEQTRVRREIDGLRRDLHEHTDEMATMLKAELLGFRLAFEDRFESRIEGIEATLKDIAAALLNRTGEE